MATVPRRVVETARALVRSDLVKKGFRHPERIPPAILGLLFPGSRWGPNWYRDGDYVMFEDGGFAGGAPSRAELSVRLYREARQLRQLLPEAQYDRSLEVGCGYGRLSGWIAEHADAAVGIDPDEEAIEVARTMHPEMTFVATGADDLPFGDDSFDLAVSWGVLQHVPPESIERVVSELRRVLTDEASVVLCEKTRGESGRTSWVRSVATYESLFEPYELQSRAPRPAEPTFDYAEYSETMVFGSPSASERRTPDEPRPVD